MITDQQLHEIKNHLDRVSANAKEVGKLWGVADYVMMTLQKEGREIRQSCEWIMSAVGTGDVAKGTSVPVGYHSIDTARVAAIQSELQVLIGWAQEMEGVPSYPDSDAKNSAAEKCKQIPAKCEQIWRVLYPSTGGPR